MGTDSDDLKVLRETFPDWVISARCARPLWRVSRRNDCADKAAAVTELRGNDLNEIARFLLRIRAIEVKWEDEEEDDE